MAHTYNCELCISMLAKHKIYIVYKYWTYLITLNAIRYKGIQTRQKKGKIEKRKVIQFQTNTTHLLAG